MKTNSPETERINLSLTKPTIKALRMIAVLTGKSPNQVVEELVIKGGLQEALNAAWAAGGPATVTPKDSDTELSQKIVSRLLPPQVEPTPRERAAVELLPPVDASDQAARTIPGANEVPW